MRWWLIPAAVTLPLLGIACSDSPSKAPPTEAKGRKFVLTYFNIPG